VTALLIVIIIFLIAVNVALWNSGFVQKAENPEMVLNRPVRDPKEKKAILKRLRRWKEQGKLSASEFDVFYRLCQSEWD